MSRTMFWVGILLSGRATETGVNMAILLIQGANEYSCASVSESEVRSPRFSTALEQGLARALFRLDIPHLWSCDLSLHAWVPIPN